MPRRLLALLPVLAAAAAAWSSPALAAGEPTNTEPPSLTGRPQVGATLTADRGTWTGATSYAYQWERCDWQGAGCQDIAGATALTYLVSSADVGGTLVFAVTASNLNGSTLLESDPSSVITAFSLGTTHFVVHYGSDPAGGAPITQTQAGDVGALAERAYTAELADGYPAPLSDGTKGGDSRIDIYILAIAEAGVLGYAMPETAAAQTSGYVVLNGAQPAEALTEHAIAHELFHLIQFGIWLPAPAGDAWLLEGSAEWMGFRADGFAGGFDLGDWDMSLDCRDAFLTYQCDLLDDYKNGGYSRWPFFEYVAERWGNDFTKSIFQQGAAGPGISATTAVANAIAAKGSSLSDTFNDWTTANLTGAYSVEALQTVLPPTYGTAISTGTVASLNAKTAKGAPTVTTGAVGPVTVAINHLSARYLAIRRGNATLPDGPCYKATLSLSVAMPSGIGARPAFWWSQKNPDGTKQPAQPLAVNGDTATISLPWDTCDWGGSQGYLALPNPSLTRDAQDYKVTGTISIDRSAEATATAPPDPVKIPGTAVDANPEDVPRIDVFGPQLIRLSTTSRVLRLIVSANDSGNLRAALGSLVLGSAKLRAGSNDVRFTLPERALRSLRTTSAAASTLTLTPLSPAGAAGKAVVRRVRVDKTVSKPKPKPKPKAKVKR